MASNLSNKARSVSMLEDLENYLNRSYKNGALPIGDDGRLSRDNIRKAIKCGQNWLNQNRDAKKTICDWDKKLHKEGVVKLPRATPGERDPKSELLQAKIQRLERENFDLRTSKEEYERILAERGWIEDEQSCEHGRLPW